MRTTRRIVLVTLCAVVAAQGVACTSKAAAPRPPSGSRNMIIRDEIVASNVRNAYEAVERLRPNFLRSHGPTSVRQSTGMRAKVFVDGTSMGGLDQLKGISAGQVESIEFLPAGDATIRFGTGYEGGAILVTTRKR
jgi:hypothetical protein